MNETEETETVFIHEIVFLNEGNVVPKKLKAAKGDEEEWYLDNGASNHMTGNRNLFSELNERIVGKVRFGDGSCVDIKGRGSILFQGKRGEQRLLTNIYYIPALKNNIMSLGQATEAGCEVVMKGCHLVMKDVEGRVLMKVQRSENRLYKIGLKIGSQVCLQAKITNDAWKWHARMGHVNFDSLRKMSSKRMVLGLPHLEQENQFCESCLVGKQTRTSFPQATSYRATRMLELVHADLCGPISPPTIGGNRYIFVLIDDFSRYMWSFLLKEKSEVFESFKSFKVLVESQTELKIKTLRTDRGGEFMSQSFQAYCDQSGITRHLTAPYTPQQNGVVERRNRTLLNMTRSILKAMKVPNYLTKLPLGRSS